jgi:hypothetical protein
VECKKRKARNKEEWEWKRMTRKEKGRCGNEDDGLSGETKKKGGKEERGERKKKKKKKKVRSWLCGTKRSVGDGFQIRERSGRQDTQWPLVLPLFPFAQPNEAIIP